MANVAALGSNPVSTTGNIDGGNLRTAGVVSASGTITGTTITGSTLSSTGNVNTVGIVGTGNVSTTGNITGGNLSGTGIVGTLTTASQTNITAVGTLGSLNVTGNISGGNISATNHTGTTVSVTGQLTGSQFNGSGAGLTSIPGANVTGTVPSATSAGTVTTAAQGNITSVGTLTSLAVTGAITGGSLSVSTGNISGGNINNNNANGVGNIGTATTYFNTVFAKATSAQYADLAESYTADANYPPGTVLSFGGTQEVTQSNGDSDRRIAGVVSTNPSYVMNATLKGEHVAVVALQGRVPTQVNGPVQKGDLMVSAGNGRARSEADPKIGAVIGKALEDFAGESGTIEVVVGRI